MDTSNNTAAWTIGIVILIIVLLGGWWFISSQSSPTATTSIPSALQPTSGTNTGSSSTGY